MKPADAVKEISKLLDEAATLGGSSPSQELRSFLVELSKLSDINHQSRNSARSSMSAPQRFAGKSASRRPDEAEMSKTIDELAKKLRDAFQNDDRFEAVISEPETQKLSKSNVVILFQRVFDDSKPPAKSLTKPDLFNAIRRERIKRVRATS